MVFQGKSPLRAWTFWAAVSICGIVVFIFAASFFSVAVSKRQPIEPLGLDYYQNVVGDDKVIALTFDDGPDPEKTLEILDILERLEVPATFFFTGLNALKYPEVVRLTDESGNEIGNHSFTHAYGIHDKRRRLAFELNFTSGILQNIIDKPVNLYRPPFLDLIGSDATADLNTMTDQLAWISELGYVVVGADVDSKDWAAKSSEEVVEVFFKDLAYSQGHIALLHDGGQGQYMIPVLDDIISSLKQQGYTFTTVSEVLGVNQNLIAKDGQKIMTTTQTDVDPMLGFYKRLPNKVKVLGFSGSIYIFESFQKIIGSLTRIILWLVLVKLAVMFVLLFYRKKFYKQNLEPYKESVTVIIPAYNEEENIAATIKSVLNSSYKNLEIIVVNDGSKDKTATVVRQLQREFPKRIKLISIENGGKANALNVGVSKASSEVIVSMDGDSIFKPNTIEILTKHFNNPKVGSVAGTVLVTKPKNLLNRFQHLEYITTQYIDKLSLSVVNATGVVPGPIGAWRKSDLLEVGGFSKDTLVEDQDMSLAVLAKGKRVIYEREAVAYTESPNTIRDFIKQRFRWIFGTLQCAWKYKNYLFSRKSIALGWVVLPNTVIYMIFLSVLYPFIDLALVVSLGLGWWHQVLPLYIFIVAADLIYTSFAFTDRKSNHYQILLMPLQRLFYRFVIYYVMMRSIARALNGSKTDWAKVKKRGDAQVEHLRVVEEAP